MATVEAFEAMTRKVEDPSRPESGTEGEKGCGRKPELLAAVTGRADPGVATQEWSAAFDLSKTFRGLSATIPPSVFME